MNHSNNIYDHRHIPGIAPTVYIRHYQQTMLWRLYAVHTTTTLRQERGRWIYAQIIRSADTKVKVHFPNRKYDFVEFRGNILAVYIQVNTGIQ